MRRSGVACGAVIGIFAVAVAACGGDWSDGQPTGVPRPNRTSTDTDTDDDAGASGSAGADDASFPAEGDATAPVTGDLACDPLKPFGAPALLLDPAQRSATPRLSHDELTLYFTANGAATDLFRATRTSRNAPFGEPEVMMAQSSDANDNDPSVSADHLTLFFHSGRSGNNEIYTATRASTSAEFGAPSLVPDVNDPAAGDSHPYYRAAGGGELWFTSLRDSTTYRIHMAKKSAQGFMKPAVVPGLSGAWHDWQPMVTEDGLTLLFASTRPEGQGQYDLWLATRASDAASWGTPAAIAELNSAANDFAGWISADRCRIYFSSNRDTDALPMQRVYFAERPL